jgi:hypothetical protein
MLRKLLFTLIINSAIINCTAQSFNCYVANDTIISPTVYKFDIYLQATSTDFYLRSIQAGLHFNPNFIPAGASITGSIIQGSSELISYTAGNPVWNINGVSLMIPSSTGSSCSGAPTIVSNDLFVVGTAKRISTFLLISDIPFNCETPDISMIRPSDPPPAPGVFKMTISNWTDSCSTVNISGNGIYTNLSANTLYTTLNNPLDTFCTTGIVELSKDFRIYPNPSSGEIKIESTKSFDEDIAIYNLTGDLLYQYTKVNFLTDVTLNISFLPKGIYVLKAGEMYRSCLILE